MYKILIEHIMTLNSISSQGPWNILVVPESVCLAPFILSLLVAPVAIRLVSTLKKKKNEKFGIFFGPSFFLKKIYFGALCLKKASKFDHDKEFRTQIFIFKYFLQNLTSSTLLTLFGTQHFISEKIFNIIS